MNILDLPIDLQDKIFNKLEDNLNEIEKSIYKMERQLSFLNKYKDDIASFFKIERKYKYYQIGHSYYLLKAFKGLNEDQQCDLADDICERLHWLGYAYVEERAALRLRMEYLENELLDDDGYEASSADSLREDVMAQHNLTWRDVMWGNEYDSDDGIPLSY